VKIKWDVSLWQAISTVSLFVFFEAAPMLGDAQYLQYVSIIYFSIT